MVGRVVVGRVAVVVGRVRKAVEDRMVDAAMEVDDELVVELELEELLLGVV